MVKVRAIRDIYWKEILLRGSYEGVCIPKGTEGTITDTWVDGWIGVGGLHISYPETTDIFADWFALPKDAFETIQEHV